MRLRPNMARLWGKLISTNLNPPPPPFGVKGKSHLLSGGGPRFPTLVTNFGDPQIWGHRGDILDSPVIVLYPRVNITLYRNHLWFLRSRSVPGKLVFWHIESVNFRVILNPTGWLHVHIFQFCLIHLR